MLSCEAELSGKLVNRGMVSASPILSLALLLLTIELWRAALAEIRGAESAGMSVL